MMGATNLDIGVGVEKIMRLTIANNLVDVNVHATIVCPIAWISRMHCCASNYLTNCWF